MQKIKAALALVIPAQLYRWGISTSLVKTGGALWS